MAARRPSWSTATPRQPWSAGKRRPVLAPVAASQRNGDRFDYSAACFAEALACSIAHASPVVRMDFVEQRALPLDNRGRDAGQGIGNVREQPLLLGGIEQIEQRPRLREI